MVLYLSLKIYFMYATQQKIFILAHFLRFFFSIGHHIIFKNTLNETQYNFLKFNCTQFYLFSETFYVQNQLKCHKKVKLPYLNE